MNLTILMMTILTKKGFIYSNPGSSVSHARLPPSFFNSEVLQKENFPIKRKEDARRHPAAVGRMLFSSVPAGADNRIAPGSNIFLFVGTAVPA